MITKKVEEFKLRNTWEDYPTKKEVEILHDDSKCRLKKGDIVRFPNYHKYLPKYTLGEYGIVTERMRVIKSILSYYNSRYFDYYTCIKMITGRKINNERIFGANLTFLCKKIDDFGEVKKRLQDASE